jgi:hypothetical protein
MVRRTLSKDVDPGLAFKYLKVARALKGGAEALLTIADEDDPYGNAIGVLAVHAAIAYNDALTIAYGGRKATGGDHDRAADLLREAFGNRLPNERLRDLRRILGLKDTYSYLGAYQKVDDAQKLVAQLNQFAEWAEEAYELRP